MMLVCVHAMQLLRAPVRLFHPRNDNGRLCENCVHFVADKLYGKCALYPIFTPTDTSLQKIRLQIDYHSCVEARRDDEKCGKLGRYYYHDT